MEEREDEGSAGLIVFESWQCVVRSDQARSMNYRLEISVVARSVANTTLTNNKKSELTNSQNV